MSSITIACEPPRWYTFPLALTLRPATGRSLSFCPAAGIVSAIGQSMVPSSARMTSGEPALAQETAHSGLIGFARFLVNAHAEAPRAALTKPATGRYDPGDFVNRGTRWRAQGARVVESPT
jgi:hypothetical protein